MDRVTVAALQAMKRDGRKIVGVVAWDTPTAQILDRAGVDIVSVGDSVAVHLWGREAEGDVTLDELLLLCGAVRLGVERALVSCDLPVGAGAVEAALRLMAEGGAEIVKAEGREAVAALAGAGVAVFAQLEGAGRSSDELVAAAKELEDAGAALLDFRHSGPDAGPKVVEAVSIPVLGGLGGGPWLNGRIRLLHRLVDFEPIVRDAVVAYRDDVRAGRPVRGD
jgi:3-methyl-2-oxobutanoate hydroxymethyltransferase